MSGLNFSYSLIANTVDNTMDNIVYNIDCNIQDSSFAAESSQVERFSFTVISCKKQMR